MLVMQRLENQVEDLTLPLEAQAEIDLEYFSFHCKVKAGANLWLLFQTTSDHTRQ